MGHRLSFFVVMDIFCVSKIEMRKSAQNNVIVHYLLAAENFSLQRLGYCKRKTSPYVSQTLLEIQG